MRDIGDIFIILDKHRELTRLDRGELAKDLIDILVEEVRSDMDAERSFDGSRWDDLSDDYGRWKSTHHPGLPIGELHGKMKDEEQIRGRQTIVVDRVYISYGVDDDVRDYAMAFNFGNPANNQPARPFLGFSARCETRLAEKIREFLDQKLRESV